MIATAYHHVISAAAAKAGFALSNVTTANLARLRVLLYGAAEEAWNKWFWPELMHVEERFYRADYNSGTTYALNDEVYYPTTEKYYRALGATTGNAPTNATYWSEITGSDFVAYIDLAQAGEEEIGTIRGVYLDDPNEAADPRPIPFRLVGDRLYVLGDDVPSSVYVWWRERMPTYLGDTFDVAATYTAGRIVYYSGTGAAFVGDWWECLSSTSAGEDPEDTPAKWSRLEFPAFLKLPVAHAAYAEYLRGDGKNVQARTEQAEAQRLLLEQVHLAGRAQRQLLRSGGR